MSDHALLNLHAPDVLPREWFSPLIMRGVGQALHPARRGGDEHQAGLQARDGQGVNGLSIQIV